MAFRPVARTAALVVICGVVAMPAAIWPTVVRGRTVSPPASASLLLTSDRTSLSQAAPGRTELKGTDGPIFGLAWAPDGGTLASAGFKQVHLWRTGAAAPLRTFRAHTDLVRSVSWSPDGSRIASVGDDGVAYVWNAETLQPIMRLETGPSRSIAWSPDGSRLATAGASGQLQIRAAANGALLHSARLQSTLTSVSWSPDGKTVVTGAISGMATRWDADTGAMVGKMYVSWPARNDVNGITWSPQGRVVAMAHGARGAGGVMLWNPATGTVAQTLTNAGGWLRGISWSPDGQWLAIGGEDGNVRIQNLETLEVAATLPTDSKPIWSVAWSPDGRRLAAGNTGSAGPPRVGGTVVVWDEPVPVLLGQRASDRARALETMLLERRVVTPVASRPASAASVFKEGGAYGAIMRLEPPFGSLETSFVESDLRSLQITSGSLFEMRCREHTFVVLLGQSWSDVPRGEWVAYLSMEGGVIFARNSVSANEQSGCQPGDSIFVTPRIKP